MFYYSDVLYECILVFIILIYMSFFYINVYITWVLGIFSHLGMYISSIYLYIFKYVCISLIYLYMFNIYVCHMYETQTYICMSYVYHLGFRNFFSFGYRYISFIYLYIFKYVCLSYIFKYVCLSLIYLYIFNIYI